MLQNANKVLVTPRLILRPIEEGDRQALYDILSDEDVTRYMRVFYKSIEDADEWIKFCAENSGNKCFERAVELKETGTFIGGIGVIFNERDNSGELGYYLDKAYWRQGLMSEAAAEVVRFLLCDEGFNRISAKHSVRNPASGAVLRKIGMSYEGMSRDAVRNRFGYEDCHNYALLKRDLSF